MSIVSKVLSSWNIGPEWYTERYANTLLYDKDYTYKKKFISFWTDWSGDSFLKSLPNLIKLLQTEQTEA